MKYGFFDESKKEYVITRPDTPAPWVNYLGSPEYGAIISNNAGGYSFAKSGANGRILRYIFNQFDQPGRYIYLRDQESEDYWSASWQPVGKDLNSYKSECHHGTAYTKMMADYSEIHSEVRYYVPLNQSYEVWNLAVTNTSDRMRKINVTGYAEFTNNSNYEQDQVNLQYSQFITRTVFRGNRVRQMILPIWISWKMEKMWMTRSLLTVSSDLQVQRLIPGVEAEKVSLEDIMDTTIRSEWKMVF